MWTDDGTGAVVGNGNEVSCVTESTTDSKFNALWKEGDDGGAVAGEHYWLVKVLRGDGVWVGLSSETKFGPGYRCKGTMYGGPGNTSDGGALVTSQFGDAVKVTAPPATTHPPRHQPIPVSSLARTCATHGV
jgi:hypothetical protein